MSHVPGGYALSLYDHRADPKLSKDVQAEHSEVMTNMVADLKRWHIELDETNTPVKERTLQQEEALRALGYIE